MIQLYLKFVFALILIYSLRLFCMFDYLVTCNARLKIGLSIEKDIDNLSKDFLSCACVSCFHDRCICLLEFCELEHKIKEGN